MKTTNKEKSMSDLSIPETPAVPETDSPTYYILEEVVETPNPEPNVHTQPTLLQTFAMQTVGSLVVAIVAPITASVLVKKLEERKTARAAKRQAKADAAAQEQSDEQPAEEPSEAPAETASETKTAKK